MNKLNLVNKHLREISDVEIVDVIENNSVAYARMHSWSQTMDYLVAPKEGLYTADELQDFMLTLIPADLKPTSKDHFRQYSESLEFGKLYFDEKIGEEKQTRILTLTDSDLLNSVEMVDGGYENVYGFDDKGVKVVETTGDLMRRTWVRVYPCVEYIKDLQDGKLSFGGYRTDVKTLQGYKPKSWSVKGLVNRLTK